MGIGPSTKETTLHHFRDPLVDELCDDTDIDFVGVILAGIPQDNASKYFTGDRIGALAEAMRVKEGGRRRRERGQLGEQQCGFCSCNRGDRKARDCRGWSLFCGCAGGFCGDKSLYGQYCGYQ